MYLSEARKLVGTDVKSKKIFSFVICVILLVLAPRLFCVFGLEKTKKSPKINGKCQIKTCFL